MNILFLVTERRSANGICTKAVMRELVQQGYRVRCISNRERGDCGDTVEEEDIFFQLVKPRLTYRLMNWQADCSTRVLKCVARVFALGISKAKLLLSIPSWPLISPLFALRYYRAAKRMHLVEACDIVIPVYTQIDTLIAANGLKKEFPNLIYIPYFLDSLSGGYGPKHFSPKWTINRGLRWEARLLRRADRVIFMESSREHHERFSKGRPYNERVHFLDLPLIRPMANQAWFEPFDPEKINLLYLGSMPKHIRDSRFIVDVFTRLQDPKLRLYFIGPIDNAHINRMKQKDNRIIVLRPVSHQDGLRAMASASVLINLGNRLPNMTPSKVFEYISTGKPILSTFSSQDDSSIRYLSKYPNALMVGEGPITEEVVAQVKAFIERSSYCVCSTADTTNAYEKNTPRAFAEFLESVMKSK